MARIDFAGRFQASARMNLVPGAYYLGFGCRNCGADLAVLDAPTQGDPIDATGEGQFEVQCPRCGEIHTYEARAMRMWQAATAMPGGSD
ncbi:MAG: hypothetical protein JWN93_3572 [Hyphomicrobiales bacterium]|nr:hypothetical protein [Hyphomicrobiales bacterium]